MMAASVLDSLESAASSQMDKNFILSKSLNQNNQNQDRQDKAEIKFKRSRHLKTSAFVALCNIIVKAPAPFAHTEQTVNQRADR